ncbi:tRNA epoxyqueuosine(34) reductase QueG [Nisaea acidiphila]|uniref:Epoxyqueuosine reductase n=1 Tax=Nisaea acidiphila TaxID=1862145 RepID=A0A9J7B132_9PROT|nr:tRNA epoxyqueuosine(34) reductase QueG [Nisaea acidiphila]UUX51389.1 tRNA epoxyqueuosine(34) reductase QueG [Nisaea acidiphila]
MEPERRIKPEQRIKDEAAAIGFSAAGITRAEVGTREQDRLREFVSGGEHGDMAWMETHLERRIAPKAIWDGARSVVVLTQNYGPDHDPMENLDARDRANISVYARNKDYHDLIKKRLKRLARWMVEQYGCQVKVFVDTAPVLEKPLAARAGLGWQGKHTNMVSREHGSWVFLGEVFTDMQLTPDVAESDHCGNCTRCLDICPTDAFPRPYALDARRCISYLTIEHKGHIPADFREAMGNRIYGCDDCLAVCPWNKFAEQASEAAFAARDDLELPPLDEFLELDDAGFRARFSGSPVKRIGRDRFLRNVLIACGNSGDTNMISGIRPLLSDPSPLVRAMAAWASKKLLPADGFSGLRGEFWGAEEDPTVRREWGEEQSVPR